MDKTKRKVIVLGEACTGKSTLVQTFCTHGQQVTKDYLMTLVADIASKIIEIDDENDVELFFFDVSGRDMLRSAVTQLVGIALLAWRCSLRSVCLRLHERVEFRGTRFLDRLSEEEQR